MIRSLLSMFSLVVLTAACSSSNKATKDAPASADAADTSCSGSGTGHVIGTISGTSLTTVFSARQFDDGSGYSIVLDDTADTCAGVPTGTNDELLFHFCAAPALGSNAVTQAAPSCPGGSGANVIFDHDGSAVSTLTSGSVDIDSIDSACVTGTFSLLFQAGTLSGNFGAATCP
jgi:hypothetical protein